MAENPTSSLKAGLTPAKGALIGGLAIVLVGVLYLQYGGSQEGELARTAPEPSSSPADSQASDATSSESTSTKNLKDRELEVALAEFNLARWQAPQLAQVIAYDPFALPAAFPQPLRVGELGADADDAAISQAAAKAQLLADAVEHFQLQLQELQQRGVQVILGERNEYVAMVGDRTLQVGDEINGFTVTAIEPDGVRVERKGIE